MIRAQQMIFSCLVVLAEKITQTTAMEDRRIRKELQVHLVHHTDGSQVTDLLPQDNFGKLLESSVVFVGRSFDQGSWIRRSTKESLVTNGRDSPVPRSNGKTYSPRAGNYLPVSYRQQV